MKSRMKIQEGIDIVADAVGVTLGPRGASLPTLSIAPPASGCPRAVPRAPGPDPIASSLSSGRNVVLAEKVGMPQVRPPPAALPPPAPHDARPIYRV